MAGFGAIGRCLAGRGCGLPPDPVGGGVVVEETDEGCEFGRARTGIVSAKSTMVLKESTKESQAISVLIPAPAKTTVRAIIVYIFKRVLPA